MATIGKNQFFEIKNGDGSSFHNLVLRKSAVESIVMSLGDKISGDVYYKDNSLSVTMHEYITYNGVNYMLINPPTIVREGVVSDNSELRGMTKYSFVFYHPMCQLSNFPFTDVAVTNDETRYLSESKVFSWIGKPADFVAKMNKNLVGTEWIVELSSRFPQDKLNELSDVIPFDNATIADACKTFYDTWGVPYVVDKVASTEASYATGKRFKLVMGLPSNEIYENASAEQQNIPFVFQMGHGVGLKNNSRTPRNNKIITRISGYGSENNIPYGYPQVRWYGTAGQAFTYGDHAGVYNNVTIEGVHFDKIISYPIYKGILDGEYVELIKHPFTRTHLMPSVYRTTLFNKISFYDAAGEANTDYDPDITLVDYYDAIYSAQYPYPNTINLQAPSYESHEFEDEKPELGEAHIISATPLNNDLTPASSWDDSLDDEGNYKQSYFQMVLPQLSFDLYACASITEEMQINMRSGACLGCTFTVQVDWDDYKRNFYDDEGNFAPNGSQRDLTKYPKSNQGSISLILQKDNSTFGTLMPNMYQYPKGETSTGADDGDTFVILGISLPESYIFAAEWRLDADMKSYMLENNVHYFDYPLKFDEDFLFHKEYILSQIRPNTVVRFNYAGQTQALFVKQITVKYGDQPLPQYDITLTDNVEVVLNQIGQVAEDVEKLSTLIAILRQSYGKNVWNELAKKLSKTQDDTAAGYITMLKGLQVGANFVPDILGEGGCLRMRDDGKVELVTDILYARMRAYFDSVVIREYKHESGNRIVSPAQGFNASRVAYIKVVNNEETIVEDASDADYFRCYWRVDDGEKKAENQFIIGDLAFCEHADVVNGSLVTKRYWRVVTGRNAGNTTTADGEAWIDLSNAHDANGNPIMTTISWTGQGGTTQTLSVKSFESSTNGYPEAHDDICMLGCVVESTRQGAIIEYVSGVDAPTYQIYQGLGADATNPYTLTNKNQISIGYNSATGKADMKVYGDAYIGDRNRSTYIEYKQDDGTQQHRPALNIKAHVEFTNSDQELDSLVQSHQRDDSYDDTEVRGLISGLQEQIDGQIETWFYNYSPVNVDASGAPTSNVPLNVAPYSDWTTDNDKIAHLGDTFTNNSTGYCWRFTRNEETNAFEWVIIEDSAVIAALQNAARAQDTADHKRRVFLCDSTHQTPTPPYDEGDLWVNVKYPWATGATYDNEILKCIKSVPRTEGGQEIGVFNINDWSLANGYTAKLNNFFNNTYAPFVQNIQGQVDKKAETFRQATDPSTPWYEEDAETHEVITDTRVQHIGDLWMDISENGGNKTYIYQNTGSEKTPVYEWVAQEVPDEVFDEIDGKAEIFVTKPTTYNERDMWIIESGTAAADIPTGCQVGDIVVSNHKRTNSYTKGDWSKKDRYTDDSAFNGYITAFLNGSGASGDSATAAAIQSAITSALGSALGSATLIDGGLMLTSLIGMRQLNDGGDPSQISDYTTWAGISGQYDNWSGNTHAKGHGIAAWYGGDMVDKEMLSQPQIDAGWGTGKGQYRWAKGVDRFDGSGYRANGNITWDEQGRVSIKDVTTIISSNNTNVLNELITFNNAFHFNLSQGTSTVLSIEPQAAFTNLYIRNTTNPNAPYHVATEDWVDDHYVSKTFFRQLFRAFKPNTTAGQADVEVQPNTIDATISNIKAMVGFWTEQYVSALGNNSDGGGGGASVLYGLNDVTPNATGDGVMGAQDGYVLTYNGSTHHWYAAATAETYVLPQATANALGGIKIGYAASGKNYAVALDTNGKAYVNVPWTDHYDWGDITNTPNTIAGYGITDAYTKTEVDSLARLESVAFSSDGVLTFTLQDGSVSYADLTHQHDFQEILDKPTTLAGFGITDAKIESGVITLGDNTITPVTSVAMTVPKGFSISGTPISKTGTLALSYSSGYEGFTTELKNMITALYSWFEVDSNGDIKTKDYTSNGTTKHRGFWSPSFISALGQGSDSGGGGQGDVTWELLQTQATDDRYIHLSYISAALESYLTTNNYVQSSDIGDMATKTWVGNQGYLTQQSLSSYYTKSEVDALARLTNVAYSSDGILAFTHQDGSTTYADFTHEHSFLELLDRPTTIAGYEISDAYINNGVVYLGNNSITPVTSVAMTVPTGFSTSGSPISKTGTLAVSYASGYEGFTTSLKEKIEALFSWFELDSEGNVKTKDYVENGTTKHRGFWSESFISALGQGVDGGGGGQGDVTWQLLEQADTRPINISHLTGALSSYATQSWVTSQGYVTTSGMNTAINALTYLNSVSLNNDGSVVLGGHGIENTILDLSHQHNFLELLDRPTTIAGYGITDAKIANGVITIGDNTITPLTSHQSVVDNNPTLAWSTKSKVATIGSTPIYVTMLAKPTYTLDDVSDGSTRKLSNYLPLTGGTLSGLLTANSGIYVPSTSYIKIGDAYLVYKNGALCVSGDSLGTTAKDFYATGGISALGQGSDSGGGGQGDVTWDLLKSSDTRQINISHLAGDANYAGVMSILTGYTTSGKNYKVQEDSNHHLYVNVPWTDNNTTYTNGTGLSLSGTTFSINSTYQTYISNGNTAYGWGNHASAGYALQTSLNALEYFYSITGGSDIIMITTNKSNSTVIDLTHQHSFLELVDRPTTVAGYGITDMGSQSVNYATSASKATNDSDGNAINSTYLKKSGGTLSNAAFGGQLMIERSGSTNMAAIGFKNSRGVLGYLATQNVDGAFVRYNAAASTSYTILDSSNSSVSKSGDTLTVKINGTSKSLTNTNTWRGIQDNLTSSTNTTESLSAKQGYLLANGSARDSTKLPLAGGTMTGSITPNTDNAIDLGSSTKRWRYIYANGMWGTSGNALRLGGNDSTLMYLTSNNRCGIGTNAPDAKLGVSGNAHISSGAKFNEICIECDNSIDNTSSRRAEINNYSSKLFFQHNTAYGIEMCNGGGNVGIGTNPSYKLHVAGDIYATGGVTCLTSTSSSDIRMKDVVSDRLPLSVEQIADAPTIKFTWKEKPELGTQVGSIAQYWQKALPESVKVGKDKEHTLSLSYGVAALLSTIVVAKKVVNHEQRIKELEEECKRLRTELSQYKTI